MSVPRVVALQPVAIIDHLIWVEKGTYSAGAGGAGGSKRISLPDLRGMIADWCDGPATERGRMEGRGGGFWGARMR